MPQRCITTTTSLFSKPVLLGIVGTEWDACRIPATNIWLESSHRIQENCLIRNRYIRKNYWGISVWKFRHFSLSENPWTPETLDTGLYGRDVYHSVPSCLVLHLKPCWWSTLCRYAIFAVNTISHNETNWKKGQNFNFGLWVQFWQNKMCGKIRVIHPILAAPVKPQQHNIIISRIFHGSYLSGEGYGIVLLFKTGVFIVPASGGEQQNQQ